MYIGFTTMCFLLCLYAKILSAVFRSLRKALFSGSKLHLVGTLNEGHFSIFSILFLSAKKKLPKNYIRVKTKKNHNFVKFAIIVISS